MPEPKYSALHWSEEIREKIRLAICAVLDSGKKLTLLRVKAHVKAESTAIADCVRSAKREGLDPRTSWTLYCGVSPRRSGAGSAGMRHLPSSNLWPASTTPGCEAWPVTCISRLSSGSRLAKSRRRNSSVTDLTLLSGLPTESFIAAIWMPIVGHGKLPARAPSKNCWSRGESKVTSLTHSPGPGRGREDRQT